MSNVKKKKMPSGRRYPGGRNAPGSRVQFSPSNIGSSSFSSGNGNGADDKKSGDPLGVRLLAPKHVPIPSIPVDGQLMFEALSLATSIIAACLQLLHLYRTIWWLPQSYNEYSMVSYYTKYLTLYRTFKIRNYFAINQIYIHYSYLILSLSLHF